MNSKNIFRGVIAVLLMTLILMLISYGIQCTDLILDNMGITIVSFVLSALLAPVISGAFLLLTGKSKSLGGFDKALIILVTSLIFIVLMIVLFPVIEVPYSIIPRREMASGYLQLLIQIFTVAGAGVTTVVSGIVALVKGIGRSRKKAVEC